MKGREVPEEKYSLTEKIVYSTIFTLIFAFLPAFGVKFVSFVFGLQWNWWWPCYGVGVIIAAVIVIVLWIANLEKRRQQLENSEIYSQ